MQHLDVWLGTVPPLAIYLLLVGVVGVESMGVPLPGEIALVSAALLATRGVVDPWGVAAAAAAGAITGDSLGYAIGRRRGYALLDRLSRRFPRHIGPGRIRRAERLFRRWGIWAVFFGRFVALLRMFAGPIAGSLRLPYVRFALANALGAIAWAGVTTWAVYVLGRAAEKWLSDLSWSALVAVIVLGGCLFALIRLRRRRRTTGGGTRSYAKVGRP